MYSGHDDPFDVLEYLLPGFSLFWCVIRNHFPQVAGFNGWQDASEMDKIQLISCHYFSDSLSCRVLQVHFLSFCLNLLMNNY